MEWLTSAVPAWIQAASALATAIFAGVAYKQYRDSREIKYGLDDYEWDVLKVVSDTGMDRFTTDLHDLTFYMRLEADSMQYHRRQGWLPDGISLSLSTKYVSYCEMLVSRKYLVSIRRGGNGRKYELSSEGYRLLNEKSDWLKEKDYKGVYENEVRREIERRKEGNTFYGEHHIIDDTTETVDLIIEYPLPPAREKSLRYFMLCPH